MVVVGGVRWRRSHACHTGDQLQRGGDTQQRLNPLQSQTKEHTFKSTGFKAIRSITGNFLGSIVHLWYSTFQASQGKTCDLPSRPPSLMQLTVKKRNQAWCQPSGQVAKRGTKPKVSLTYGAVVDETRVEH